jgi:hypothetical protein
MGRQLAFRVEGYPPGKNEAKSLLAADHLYAGRVLELLRSAKKAADEGAFSGFGAARIGLDVLLYCRDPFPPSDATNYLGGIGDVLEDKCRWGALEHLGDLADFGLYANDRQICEVAYRLISGEGPRYDVRLWELDEPTDQATG